MKNYIKKIIYTILILIITIVFTLFCRNYLNNVNTATNTNKNNNTNNQINSDYSTINLTEATVIKVVDGDTIWVNIDGIEQKVRLIGIDSPEYTKEIETYGKEATDFTTNNLLGNTIYLQKDISDTDSYDRLLRYVWLEKIDTINKDNVDKYLFNNILVSEGLAESNYYKPDILLQDYLEDSENKAKDKKIGMWQ